MNAVVNAPVRVPEWVIKRRRERRKWHGGPVKKADSWQHRRAVVHNLTTVALRNGTLLPWPVCAMWDCPQRRVFAHHTTYGKNDWSYVTWLCRRHHHQLHVEHASWLRQPD